MSGTSSIDISRGQRGDMKIYEPVYKCPLCRNILQPVDVNYTEFRIESRCSECGHIWHQESPSEKDVIDILELRLEQLQGIENL